MYLIQNKKTKLYWSNEFGWCNLSAADRFTGEEKTKLNLPMEGEWKTLWDADHLQFARLIAELESAGVFDDKVMATLQMEMDCFDVDILDIIERAQKFWDDAKSQI